MSNDPHGQTNQPLPRADNPHPAVHDLLIEDIRARDAFGQRKYGQRLRPFNGRSSLRDAYEEVIDLAVYLRVLIYEAQVRAEGLGGSGGGTADAVADAVKFERDAWVDLLTQWRIRYELREGNLEFISVPIAMFDAAVDYSPGGTAADSRRDTIDRAYAKAKDRMPQQHAAYDLALQDLIYGITGDKRYGPEASGGGDS